MSSPSQQTRLAELLDTLELSQAELARRLHTSLSLVASVVHGGQTSATGRVRTIVAMNARWAELRQPELAASDLFPAG